MQGPSPVPASCQLLAQGVDSCQKLDTNVVTPRARSEHDDKENVYLKGAEGNYIYWLEKQREKKKK